MAVLKEPKRTLVRFDDRSYRWTDMKRSPWDGTGEDRAVLDALIGSPRYRGTYLSPDAHEHDAGTVHGPYRVADIPPGDFEGMSPAAAQAVADEFSDLYQSPPAAEVLREIAAPILPRLRGAACYQLRPIVNAEHEWAFALMEFRESVAIARDAGEVTLIVMAID